MTADAIEQYRLIELVGKGGWTMYPLLACSLLALAVIIERFFNGPRRKNVIPEQLRLHITELGTKRNFDELVGICRASGTPLARIIMTTLRNIERPREQIIEAIERCGRQEIARLQRFLGILGTIAAITPLLGLLGTVFGMIETFKVIQIAGVGNAEALSGGISEALITTATGLTIAIPTLVFYRYYLGKAKQLILELEQISADFLDTVLLAPKSKNSALDVSLAK